MKIRRFFSVVSMLLVLAIGLSQTNCLHVSAGINDTKKQIEEAEENKKKLEEEQAENEKELNGLKGERNSLRGQLNNLNEQLEEVSNELDDLNDQILLKEKDIEDTKAALEAAVATERQQYESMVVRIRAMYERNDTGYFSALITSGNFGALLNAADFFARIEDYDQQKMEEFKESRMLVDAERARLDIEMNELQKMKTQAEEKQAKVSDLIESTKTTIGAYSGKISEAEQEALEYERQIEEQEKDLEYLKKKLAEEIALSQRAANGVWRDISEVTFEENDRYLLANLIYCEAGGEPYDGQVAVGAVVINRVLSSVFPDTVSGVIYQNKQFSPVASGRLALALAENRATDACYRAADEAMSGVSNVGNCVFFRTPIEGLSGIQIGGHIFY